MSQASTHDYIQQLTQEGDYQSSGRFSLEAKKALQKMQAYQLLQPSRYILQLVSCAVMRNATQIQIDIGGRDVRMGFDGDPFSEAELEQIFECCHNPGSVTAAGAHLAIALQAMKTYNPDVLIVESSRDGNRSVLQLYEDQVWIETLKGLKSRRQAVNYVGMEDSLNLLNMCFPSLLKNFRPDLNCLQERAFACPVPLYVNGKCLEWPFARASVLLGGPDPAPTWAQAIHHKHLPEFPFWGMVRFGGLSAGNLVFIQAGVSFSKTDPEIPAGVSLYLMHDGLKRDLSHESILQDDVQQELRAEGLKALKKVQHLAIR